MVAGAFGSGGHSHSAGGAVMTTQAMKTRQRASRVPGEFVGLRFAVYTRKSNEDARHEDHRSTGRQVAQATAYVEARRGEVLPDHVY